MPRGWLKNEGDQVRVGNGYVEEGLRALLGAAWRTSRNLFEALGSICSRPTSLPIGSTTVRRDRQRGFSKD